MPFCSKCGSKLNDGDLFCMSCGATIVNNQQEIPAKSAVNLVLATDKKEGLLKSTSCYLVFTNNEVIFAHLSKERHKQENKAYQQQLKAEGKGFFAGSAAMFNFWQNYGERYYNMDRASILSEEPTNTVVMHETINKFVFETTRSMNHNETTAEEPGKIVIHTSEGKIKFSHKYRDTNKKIKEILTHLFGNRLKYRGSGLTLSIGGDKNRIS